MERQEIEVFLALAEELHFGRTAERLGLASGRVSQIVAKLERRFGTLLFVRSSRRVELTPAGERFRDELGPAWEQVRRAVARVTAAGRGFTGTLRVGYSSAWIGDLVLRASVAFRAEHPECEVQTQEVSLADLLGPLRTGRLDLQVTEFPVDEEGITAGPVVWREPRALMVPARHPFARRASVTLHDLSRTPVISIGGDVPSSWTEHHFPERTPSGRPIPRGPVTGAHWLEVLDLVAADRGVSPVAARAAEYYARPGIAFVPLTDAPPVEFGLLWRTAAETARVRAFAAAVVALAPEAAT